MLNLHTPRKAERFRIWARNQDDADEMVGGYAADAPELDGVTYIQDRNGDDVLPFLTGARVVRCLNCRRYMYAAAYIDSANHACIPSFDTTKAAA